MYNHVHLDYKWFVRKSMVEHATPHIALFKVLKQPK